MDRTPATRRPPGGMTRAGLRLARRRRTHLDLIAATTDGPARMDAAWRYLRSVVACVDPPAAERAARSAADLLLDAAERLALLAAAPPQAGP